MRRDLVCKVGMVSFTSVGLFLYSRGGKRSPCRHGGPATRLLSISQKSRSSSGLVGKGGEKRWEGTHNTFPGKPGGMESKQIQTSPREIGQTKFYCKLEELLGISTLGTTKDSPVGWAICGHKGGGKGENAKNTET